MQQPDYPQLLPAPTGTNERTTPRTGPDVFAGMWCGFLGFPQLIDLLIHARFLEVFLRSLSDTALLGWFMMVIDDDDF